MQIIMTEIEKKYLSFFKINSISIESKFLIGVSGGMDSMVCLELARKFSENISVAHVNYKLRGNESDRDEKIVKDYCLKWGIPFYLLVSKLDKSKNIQQEARNSRYSYYNEILTTNNLDYIITAHHLNDNVETFLLNTFRGSGINGLTGIPSTRKQIIRPLISIPKQEILKYCNSHKLKFGEDISNKSSDYKRNFLRNNVLPLLTDQFPDFFNRVSNTISNVKSDKKLLAQLIKKEVEGVITKKDDGYLIRNNNISSHAWFHFLRDFGFNHKQVIQWVENDHQSGKTIFSEQYELSNNREEWLLYPIEKSKNIELKIKLDESITNPIFLSCKTITPPTSFDPNKSIGYFDLDKLQFPLTVSKWESGDNIQPLGMKGSKKISDILIDNKVSNREKRNVWLLKSNNSIIWLIGHVVHENFKVTAKTSSCYKIKFNEND
jgi:tRNA(Ile)-lysidine synthase